MSLITVADLQKQNFCIERNSKLTTNEVLSLSEDKVTLIIDNIMNATSHVEDKYNILFDFITKVKVDNKQKQESEYYCLSVLSKYEDKIKKDTTLKNKKMLNDILFKFLSTTCFSVLYEMSEPKMKSFFKEFVINKFTGSYSLGLSAGIIFDAIKNNEMYPKLLNENQIVTDKNMFWHINNKGYEEINLYPVMNHIIKNLNKDVLGEQGRPENLIYNKTLEFIGNNLTEIPNEQHGIVVFLDFTDLVLFNKKNEFYSKIATTKIVDSIIVNGFSDFLVHNGKELINRYMEQVILTKDMEDIRNNKKTMKRL